jgi:putative ABC transport system substrate-binding protein
MERLETLTTVVRKWMLARHAINCPSTCERESGMRRREFLFLICGALVGLPSFAFAQQRGAIPRVGILWHAANEEEEAEFLLAVREGFAQLGYTEGKNLVFVNRFANEEYERFHALAAELVGLKVDVILAVTEPAALAAQKATKDIPICLCGRSGPG